MELRAQGGRTGEAIAASFFGSLKSAWRKQVPKRAPEQVRRLLVVLSKPSVRVPLTRNEGTCWTPHVEMLGSVLDVEMTMLDKQSKGVPIDEQANDDVVHLYRFREADRLTDQAFDPCS